MEDAETEETGPQAGASRRDRSPNYPALTFSEALSYARMIWNEDKQHLVTQDVAAVHMGFAKASGATFPLIAAMKRYGLLESEKKEVKITADAHYIFVHPDDDPDRVERVRKLAMMPTLFGDVLQKFSGSLPSDPTLRAKLQTDFKFASSNAADIFIRGLREAVAIVGGAGVATGGTSVDDSAEAIKERSVFHPTEPAINASSTSVTAMRTQPAVQGGAQTRPWDLGDGVVITVVLPASGLTKKNLARLKKYVAALEMEASIAWDEDAPENS